MKRNRALLVATGAALLWFLDGRHGPFRREQARDAIMNMARQARGLLAAGGDTSQRDADLIAPPSPKSGPPGAGRPLDTSVSSAADDEPLVEPTQVTSGPLPLTDETAGEHQVLGGGPSAAETADR